MGGFVSKVIHTVTDIISPVVDPIMEIIGEIPIIGETIELVWDVLSGDFATPDISGSPTYSSNQIGNTISEGISVARCYGQPKIGGNKLRFNAADDTDLRIIVGHCAGPVEGITEWYVNDIAWGDLTGTHTKSEYTGTRTQTADARFSSRASAYRSIAYTAFTFEKNDKQIGYDPNITVIMQGMKCAPLAGGADAYTRNPGVILYDFYLNVEGKAAGVLDLNSFKSLEVLCDEVPTDSSLPRYRFDFNFDTNMTINDAKKLLWRSFNGQVIMSQGKYKCVWDSSQMANGSGGLTAKTVSHTFDMDNIVKGSLTWSQPEPPNIVRIHYIDAANSYQKTSVEVRDENDIDTNGEILYEETCYYILDAELARRRAKYKFNNFKYDNYNCNLIAFSGAGDLELFDLVTVTHTLPGWTTKQFIVTSKSENEYGQPTFTLRAYYSGVYDDTQTGTQVGYESTLPNPYKVPDASTGISAAMTAVGTAYDFDAVRVSFTPPATDPFYSYSEVYASKDDSTYYYVGRDGTGTFTFNALGVIYEPGDTCYIKIRSVSTMTIPEDLPGAADASVSITSTMRLGSFFAGTYDFWGGNAVIDHADTKIVLGNLDGTPKIALGTSADAITYAGTQAGFFVDGDGYMRVGSSTHGLRFNPVSGVLDVPTKVKVGDSTYIDIDGVNARIRSSNYVSGVFGAGFTLEPDLLEVGNIAARGIIRTAVFQKDVVSAIGGNLAVLPADLLNATMSADDDDDDFVRITEAGDTRITEAVDTRIIEGYAVLTIEGNETFASGDIVRIKDGTYDEWIEIGLIDDAPIYSVIRDKAGDYADGSNPEWPKGASVVNYGGSGDGGIYMTASDTNAPYLSIFTHAGEPWDTITTHIREGNLNGYAGYETDIYGWASYIDANNYIKIDPTNGIRMSGQIVITSGATVDAIQAAQDAADAAQSDADDALSTLSDIAADDKITPVEKLTLKPLWDDIVAEATLTTGTLPIQAAEFSVDDSVFDAAYAALYAYVVTSLDTFASMSATTTITRATWDADFEAYYAARTDLLNAIAVAAKDLADAAQDAADDAQTDATTALGSLSDISADTKITPVEKLTLLPIWNSILSEKTDIDTQADSLSVSKVAYGTAYDTLYAYVVTSLDTFGNMATTTTITRATWDADFEAYYNAKIEILNAIAAKAALLADLAQCTGDLDDIVDGETFGRVALTSISAGKIVLTAGVSGSLPVANSDAKCTDALADQTSANEAATIAGQGDLATVNTVNATYIDAGSITLVKCASETTDKMFTDGVAKTNIEAWRKTGSLTYIDGEYIFAKSITADKFISTLYGDMNQAMDYVKKVLGAGDEYEHDLTAADLAAGADSTIDADTHFDYGISIRIATAVEWDDGGAVWDTGTWDEPTDASGSWTSASMDLGSSKTLQMALRYTVVEETPASTTPTIKAQYSTNDADFGANSPDFDDGLWETLSIANITGDIYKATGALLTFRYFKIKTELATTVTTDKIILHAMTYLGNVINVFGMVVATTIASGGTVVPLTGMNSTPAIAVTPVGATLLFPLITAQSKDSVTIKLYNLAGNDVGGNCNLTIIGE